MPDRPEFGTLGFYEAVAAALNADRVWREMAGQLTYTFIFNYGQPVNKAFLFKLDHGEVTETAELRDPDQRPADFVITGAPEHYAEVIKGDVKPAAAMATQKLKIQGKQTVLLRHMKKLSYMLEKMTQMDPVFS